MEKFLRSASGDGSHRLVDTYTCRVLAGMRTTEERRQSLLDFKQGEVRILIATDVAARGIDIRELPFVVNVTLPDIPQTYVHRVGRVGRADRLGLAISLVATTEERVWYCQKGTKPPCADTTDYDKGGRHAVQRCGARFCRVTVLSLTSVLHRFLSLGNCIWYNEPKCRKDIEKLLNDNKVNAFTMLYPSMEVPLEIKNVMNSCGYGVGASDQSNQLMPKLQATSERVQRVQDTESALQVEFWNLRNKFRALALHEPPS
jgi:ATP-dependent RNA helicase DDX1